VAFLAPEAHGTVVAEAQPRLDALALLTVCTWKWGTRYGAEYVDRLSAGVTRNLRQPHDFRVFTPEPEDEHLTAIPGCFARLRMFDPEWQARNGFKPGDRIVCLDLDLIVTGQLDELFDRTDDFVILQGANAANPCPYNGSVMMFRAGTNHHLWEDFSLDAVKSIPAYEFPDDQGWYAAKRPDAGAWNVGPESGVYAYQKPGWPRGEALPKNASIVAFPGWRDPSGFTHLDWVKRHWIGEKVAA
jgi:hypothetical protein